MVCPVTGNADRCLSGEGGQVPLFLELWILSLAVHGLLSVAGHSPDLAGHRSPGRIRAQCGSSNHRNVRGLRIPPPDPARRCDEAADRGRWLRNRRSSQTRPATCLTPAWRAWPSWRLRSSRLIRGSAADLAAAAEALTTCRCVHIAAHSLYGIFDEEQSGIEFADGRLTMDNLKSIGKIACRAVVLSSCQSGLFSLTRNAETRFGLPAALQAKGAALCSGVLPGPACEGPGHGGLAGRYPAGGSRAGGVGLQVWAAV
jgi:hypothetical protein